MKSPAPWKLDRNDPSIIYDANGNIIAEDYKFLHVDDFEAICKFHQNDDRIEQHIKNGKDAHGFRYFREVIEPKVQDLKWANGWGSETPEIVLICRELEHKISDIPDKAFGHTHTVRCDKCGYFYKYDSS